MKSKTTENIIHWGLLILFLGFSVLLYLKWNTMDDIMLAISLLMIPIGVLGSIALIIDDYLKDD